MFFTRLHIKISESKELLSLYITNKKKEIKREEMLKVEEMKSQVLK